MHRTQVLLEEHQYQRLRTVAAESGRSIGELVRRAIDESYGERSAAALQGALAASHGAWADRDIDGAEYVEILRPGLDAREKAWR